MSAIHCSQRRKESQGELLLLITLGQLHPHDAQKPDGTTMTIRLCPLCEDSFRRWSSDGLVRSFIEGVSILGAGHPGA